MDIGYVWDSDKYEVARRKHDVAFFEVVAAMEDEAAFEEIEEVEGRHFEVRSRLIGRTPAGRLLLVVHTDEDVPLYRIVTAYNAPKEWGDEYERRRAGA